MKQSRSSLDEPEPHPDIPMSPPTKTLISNQKLKNQTLNKFNFKDINFESSQSARFLKGTQSNSSLGNRLIQIINGHQESAVYLDSFLPAIKWKQSKT